jgi:plasmid stability protein
MKAITIRGIDSEIDSRLRKKAAESGDSINTTILKLLRKALQLDKDKPYPEYHDLDNLAGTWARDERAVFDKFQEGFSQIDKDLWT